MKFHSWFNANLNSLVRSAILLASVRVISLQTAVAQQLVVDFRFDGQTGAAATTQTLIGGNAGQTYTIDIWATVVPVAATANSNLGLQAFGVRGASDITVSGGAFTTGAGIGTVAASFGQLAPFNPAGFTQPHVSDMGSTSNNGTSITNVTPDGILDFGGTMATQRLTFLSNTGGLIFGGGATGSANTTTNPTGWQWEVGQFKFTTGTASTIAGATSLFVPLQVSSGTSTAATISTNGSTAVSVPVTVGSSIKFVVGSGGGGGSPTIGITGPMAVANTRFMQSQTYNAAAGGTISNSAGAGSNTLSTAAGTNVTGSVTGTGNSITALSTGSNTVAAGSNTTYGGNLVTGIGIGAQTVMVTETDATATNSPQSVMATINVLAPRSVTVNGAGVSAANPLLIGNGMLANANGAVAAAGTASLVTGGIDASTTRVNVATTAVADVNGVSGTGGNNAVFNSDTSTGTRIIGGNLTGFGTVSGSTSYGVNTLEAAATNDTTSYSPVTVFYQANAGNAAADNTGSNSAFGASLTGIVAHNGGYAGLESKITSVSAGAGSDARDASGNGGFAQILAGNNATANGGGSATASMAWRTRTTAEAAGGAPQASLSPPPG